MTKAIPQIKKKAFMKWRLPPVEFAPRALPNGIMRAMTAKTTPKNPAATRIKTRNGISCEHGGGPAALTVRILAVFGVNALLTLAVSGR